MGFVVSGKDDHTDLVELELWIDQRGRKAEPEAEGATKVTFGLRPRWLGGDIRRINNALWGSDDKGRPITQSGSAARTKVLCGVVSVQGLDDRHGRPIQKITPEVYDDLPGDVCLAVLNRLNELNQDEEPKAGE